MSTASSGWSVVVDLLERAGVDVVFGLPADDVSLLEALDGSRVRMVVCRDQRNAAFAATGYALHSGRPGVCLVGKGPALTNTVTGLLEARYADAPLVVIAAGTSAEHAGTRALQEADQLAMVRPLVSWARRVEAPERLARDLDEALLVSGAGAQEPTYLELPDHLLDAACPPLPAERDPALLRVTTDPAAVLDRMARAARPVVLVGGGMRHHSAGDALERLAARLDASVFVTASGRGAFDEAAPNFCGVAGLYCPPEMQVLWEQTDLVICLGSRLEETAVERPGFAPAETELLQVNLRERDLDATRAGLMFVGDAEQVVEQFLDRGEALPTLDPLWGAQRSEAHAALQARREHTRTGTSAQATVPIEELLAVLDAALPADRILVQENGLCDMWPYFFPAWTVEASAGSIVPSEQTTLGFGAAAAAGVALADPGRTVVALVGDGAFDMVRNDIVTFAEENIPVLYIVLRNGGYGWLQAQLDERMDDRTTSYAFLRSARRGPTAGPEQWSITDGADLESVLSAAVERCLAGKACVVEVVVDPADGPLHPRRAVDRCVPDEAEV